MDTASLDIKPALNVTQQCIKHLEQQFQTTCQHPAESFAGATTTDLCCYEQIVALSPNMIALLDQNHHFLMVNDSYLKAFNKQRQQIIGTHIKQLVGEEEYTQFTRPNLDRAFSGDPVQVDSWFTFEGTGRRFITMSYLPVHREHHGIRYVVVNARDISALKQAETDRQRIFDLSLDMLCVFDFEGKFIETNPAWLRIMGWSKEELQQKTWLDLVCEEDRARSIQVARRLFEGESISGFEARCRCRDDSYRWLAWSAYPDPDQNRIFSTVRDISSDKRMREELLKLATTDPLTGAGNRRHFIDLASSELLRVRRYGLQMALLMIDVDHFKEVNDTYGHGVGDEVLKRLVDCCYEQLRKTDIFGRFGGEEFAAVLVNTDNNAALKVCERLLQAIAQLKVMTPDATISVTASLGLTMYAADDSSIESLLKRADDALYQAKNSGRNQLVVY